MAPSLEENINVLCKHNFQMNTFNDDESAVFNELLLPVGK